MIYRVSFDDDADGNHGYDYVSSLQQAQKLLKDWQKDAPEMRTHASIDKHLTPRSQSGIIRLLQQWGSHADNG